MRGNIGNMMKQAQMMQENMRQMQENLASIEVEGQSGAGMVKVTMTCRHDVKRVHIDSSLIGDDKEMLEDLVAAAFNDAVRKVETTTQEKMAALTSGMGLPPGIKFPFQEYSVIALQSSGHKEQQDIDSKPQGAIHLRQTISQPLIGKLSPDVAMLCHEFKEQA